MSDWPQPGDEPVAPPYAGPPPVGPHPYQQSPYQDPYVTNPYAANPYLANPYKQGPYTVNPYQQFPPGGYGYGVAAGPPGERRPGVLTAAAVLGLVAAGLLIVAAFLLFFGASVVTDMENDIEGHSSYAAEFVVAGLANLLAGGLLIGGGVSLLGRNPRGRLMYIVGSAVVLVATVYWLARWATKRRAPSQ